MIKYHLTRVLEALKTDNSKALSDLINTQMQLDTEKYYYDYAVQKSQIFKNIIERPTEYSDIRIKARKFSKNYKTYVDYSDIEVIEKDTKLEFKVSFPGYIEVKKIEWLIVNTGYEARKSNQLRGNLFESSEVEDEIPINLRKRKTEHTSYSGVHYVISKVTDKSNHQYYSTPFKVRVS
ncbi:nucleotide-binding domain-containing protein [Paracholeplasma brassicae]|nr:hypothetical protein [Paracholeplasma brassicae]